MESVSRVIFLEAAICFAGNLSAYVGRGLSIGVRDGGAGGGSCPPIRAVCRHEFGQRVDIIRAKHNTCLNKTN